MDRGLTYLIPGFQGDAAAMYLPLAGLRAGGLETAVRVVSFGRPFGTMGNLTDYDGNRKIARELAREVVAFRREHPAAPIDLVGYSGGGAIALWMAEALPADVRLRHVILIQPAISRGYDLTPALRRVDGVMYHFYSPGDWLVLGMATRLFGTMDRKREDSAGKDGFDLSAAVRDAGLRDKLREIPWRPFMITYAHFGDHTGLLLSPWNKRFVAPLLVQPKSGPRAERPAASTGAAGR